jgi:biopolymer transport protein ExbD
MIRPTRSHPRREPTIALINIVFLMLIFFMVAGSLAPPLERSLSLVETAQLTGDPPPDALVVHPDGRLSFRGETVADVAGFLAALPDEARQSVRLVPDRDLPAQALVGLARDLTSAGAGRVMIVTERGLQ